MKVLLIDDDGDLAEVMAPVLSPYSIDLESAQTPEDGLRRLAAGGIDLVLLDVMLPNVNGFELCRRIRQSTETHRDVPIIMLTARGDLTDVVVGLETGADDYVTKPFEPRALVARIHAVRRRFQGIPSAEPEGSSSLTFQLDDSRLTLDLDKARVTVGATPVPLTSMEYELLLVLARNPEEAHGRDDLLLALQGGTHVSPRGVDAIVYRLRNKLRAADPGADFIHTVRGRGYRLLGQRRTGGAPP
jgi:DNA-binding response OmpR family regulator